MFLVLFSIAAFYSKLTWAEELNMTECDSYDQKVINAAIYPRGHIYSPGYFEGTYPDNAYCRYTIRAPSGHKVKLTFIDMDIQPFGNCGRDRLYIFDGVNERDTPMIGIVCGTEPPPPVISSRNAIFFLFNTDFLGASSGFHIKYETGVDLKLCGDGYSECKNRNCYLTQNKCDGKDDCGDSTDEENCGLPVPPAECGVTPIPAVYQDDSDRIIGGIEVRPGSWPWQADLQKTHIYPNSHSCGGALISPQWVVTAAHCIGSLEDLSYYRIHLGNHQKFAKDVGEQIRYVERIIVYPNRTNGDEVWFNMGHDMALMKLTAPVTITDYVRPACIPPFEHELPIGSMCFGTGWGETRGSGFAEYLKQVKLEIRSDEYCFNSYIKNTTICTTGAKQNTDTCHGDSGGPLNCKIGNKWYVMGVTSYGWVSNILSGLCGTEGTGAVYNRISSKTEWIKEMMDRYS